MASITLNPIFESLNGNLGKIVYYTRFKKVFARAYVKPRNPDTEKQRANRSLFRDAINSWKALTPSEKQQYNYRARRLPITGHNLYISEYMKKHLAERDITAPDTVSDAGLKVNRPYSPPVQRAVSSVPTSSLCPCSPGTASIPEKLPPG